MKILDGFSVPALLTVLLGGLAALTLTMEFVWAGAGVTPRETALVGILQFVFSVAFAWLLTRIASKREFIQSQKGFAVAAYRRINEIDQGVERLLGRTRMRTKNASPELRAELEVLNAIALGIRSSIKSSIADWGDIIGPEIATVTAIGRIKDEEEQLMRERAVPESHGGLTESDRTLSREQLVKAEDEISRLLKKLPYSLQIVADGKRREADTVDRCVTKMRRDFRRTGYVLLRGYWAPNYERDVRTMKIGDRLTISIGEHDGRPLAISAYDEGGRSVGNIMNATRSKYYVFREALANFVNASSFGAELTDIESRDFGDRHYFTAKILMDSLPPRVLVG